MKRTFSGFSGFGAKVENRYKPEFGQLYWIAMVAAEEKQIYIGQRLESAANPRAQRIERSVGLRLLDGMTL